MDNKIDDYAEHVVEGMVFVLGVPALIIVGILGSPFALIGYTAAWWERKRA